MMAYVPFDERESHLREPLVLALDIGTSSVRASLYDESGCEVPETQARTAVTILTTAEGGAELDADEAFAQVTRTIDRALAPYPSSIQIRTVAVSCFWHSLVGIDHEGRALTPVLIWADTRAASEAEELRRLFNEEEVHARTGARFHPSYWPAKLLWLSRTQAQIYESVSRWLSFSDLVALRLTGQAEASVSMASGTGILNTRSCAWDEGLCKQLKIDAEKLPRVAVTDASFGHLKDEYAQRWPQLKEARLYPAIGDGAANSIGAGCTTPSTMALMIGTSGAMRVMLGSDAPERLPPSLWCYRADRRRIVLGGALSDGGGLWAWMNEAFGLGASGEATEKGLAALEPDAHGLTVMPFWAGERSTGWHAEARGAILGLSLHTRPIEILRAGMEAVTYRFYLMAMALEAFAPGARIIASGGALRSSRVWQQIVADVLGRPLYLAAAEESSSRGAVLLALEASGKIKSIGKECAAAGEVVEPDMKRHARYQQAMKRQQYFYERLVEG